MKLLQIKERVLMKYMCMNIPTFMCHLAFVDDKRKVVELKGSDIDLFWVLVKLTSSRYYNKNKNKSEDEVKATGFNYERKDIMAHLGTNPKIKDAFNKLNGLHIITNLLNSYGNKKIKVYQPFEFDFSYDNFGELQSIDVSIDEDFIKEFNKPKQPFTLSFDYLKKLKSPQAKLLYMILADRVSDYKTQNMPYDEDIFMKMLNKKDKYTIKDAEKEIKKLNKAISEKTNIKFTVKYDTDRQKIGKDWLMFPKYRFAITRTKPQVRCKKIEYNNEKFLDETVDNILKDKEVISETKPTKSKQQFDETITEEAQKRINLKKAKGMKFDNEASYLYTVCKDIEDTEKDEAEKIKVEEEQSEAKLELDKIDIVNYRDALVEKYKNYVGMKDYQLYYIFEVDKPPITKNANETFEVLYSLE